MILVIKYIKTLKLRCSGSRTRGFIAAGKTPVNKNTIDFVTFSSTGDYNGILVIMQHAQADNSVFQIQQGEFEKVDILLNSKSNYQFDNHVTTGGFE